MREKMIFVFFFNGSYILEYNGTHPEFVCCSSQIQSMIVACIEIVPGKIFIFYSCYIISMHRNIMVFIMSLYVAVV